MRDIPSRTHRIDRSNVVRAALVLGVLHIGLIAGVSPVAAQRPAVRNAIEGAVYDTVSGRPIPFAVVSIAQAERSTLTDSRGRYRLPVEAGTWEVQVRKIGYRMASVTVAISSEDTRRDLFMSPLPFELATINVTAEADDFATRIMRQAIARKNDLFGRIHDYHYDAYIKFIVRDLAKDRDSAESVFLITESQTSAYWEQPDRYQEVITARRQSTNLPAENNLVSVGQIVNFNTNRIDLQKYSVVSPTADDALDHYRYHVLDTLDVAGRTVFRLAIEPKSNAAPLFVGMIDVADSTFDVLAVDVATNEAIRFDFFENLRYRQRLADFGDDHWMPEEIRFSGELHVGVPLPGFPEHISFEHIASLREFRFDQGNAPVTLGEYLVVVDDDADDIDSTTWRERRVAPLTDVEQAAYTRIDSVENQPTPFGTKLLTGALGTIALSGNPDFFHFNRVEGPYLGAGWTWRGLSPDVILRARAGYAFDREDWQHRYGAQYRLSERRRLWVGASYHEQVVNRPTFVSPGENPTYLALFAKFDPFDYYREKGASFFVSTKLVNFTRTSASHPPMS
jgi:hypothetical protein